MLGEPPDHAQRLDLVVERQAIAALEFDRRGTVGGKSPQARERKHKELVFRARTEVADGSVDTPPRLAISI